MRNHDLDRECGTCMHYAPLDTEAVDGMGHPIDGVCALTFDRRCLTTVQYDQRECPHYWPKPKGGNERWR